MERIMTTFETYFSVNPYSGWFNVLDFVIAGADASYYDATASACHLDLVPYATTKKWMHLTQNQRRALISMAGNTLGTIIRDSSVRTLVLNGRSVVKGFELATGSNLTAQEMPAWSLRSGATRRVRGIAFTGTVDRISGVNLDKKILVIGFNHNLQSSFGVTTRVLREIRHWIREIAGTRRW